jgi:hypothetical protein
MPDGQPVLATGFFGEQHLIYAVNFSGVDNMQVFLVSYLFDSHSGGVPLFTIFVYDFAHEISSHFSCHALI